MGRSIFESSFFRKLILILVLLVAQGCQSSKFTEDTIFPGSQISGKIPFSTEVTILLKNTMGSGTEVPLQKDGSFFAKVRPGTYNIFLKTAGGKVNLIKRGVTIEDNMTVNVVDVDMIPFPRIISVAVPIVYSDSAVVEWETDIASDGRVDYGTDAGYGYSTFTDTELKEKHRIQIYGLKPGTTYHFRVVASRYGLEAVENFSPDYMFMTELAEK